jgi:hypothetical protein
MSMDWNDSKKTVASWLKEISNALGTQFTLNEEGMCSLFIGGDTLVTVEVSREFPLFHLCSPLLSRQNGNDEELLIRCLELNASPSSVRGGAIALTPGGKDLFFCQTRAIQNITSEEFSDIICRFYETAVNLKLELQAAHTH